MDDVNVAVPEARRKLLLNLAALSAIRAVIEGGTKVPKRERDWYLIALQRIHDDLNESYVARGGTGQYKW